MSLARGERLVLIITGFFLAVTSLGIFGVVLKLAALSQVILTGLNFVFRPMVSRLYAARDLATLGSIYRSITRWIFILTLPLSYFFIFYPGAVLSLFGAQFSAGALALTIVAAGYLFEYGTSATQVIINMTGKSWLSLFNQLLYIALVALLAVWLVPARGIVGAAAAVAGGIVLINLLRLYQSYRIVGFTPYSWYLLKPIAAALLAGIVIRLALPGGAIGLLAAGYITLYGILVLAFRLSPEDRALLRALFPRGGRTAPDKA